VHRDFHAEVAGHCIRSRDRGSAVRSRCGRTALAKFYACETLAKGHPVRRWAQHRPDDLPTEKVGYALLDLDRARPLRRDLRRKTARRPVALDPDAGGLPAARAGPPLRARPGRVRLQPREQDRLDARMHHRDHRTAAAGRRVGGTVSVHPPSRGVRRRPDHPLPLPGQRVPPSGPTLTVALLRLYSVSLDSISGVVLGVEPQMSPTTIRSNSDPTTTRPGCGPDATRTHCSLGARSVDV
jgi:hypothetical protein